jgi:hypothetical protein
MTDFSNAKLRGCWSGEQIAAFLRAATIPLRLSVHDGVGSPWVMSLWFLPEDDALWCATPGPSKLADYVARQPQCGFEVAGDTPPYRGVRGKGECSIVPERGGEMLRRLLDRYAIGPETRLARGLLGKIESEVAIRIRPTHLTSWDFTERMKDAVAAGTQPPAT